MNTNNKEVAMLEDVKINVKLKISALWATVMFLFAYVDIFSYFRPGIIEGIMAGKIASMQINQGLLVFTTLYVLIPSVMVFLSLTLRPVANRWTNMIVSAVYAASIMFFCIGESWAYYIGASIVEIALLFLVIWYAWKWPRLVP
jgi:hypothetical protein